MLKKAMVLVIYSVMAMNLCGCFLFLAGVAGGTGTAIWLSGKLTQEFHEPYRKTIDAAKEALKSLDLPVVKETEENRITQIKSQHTNGKEIWIDITPVSETSTKVEVRVGGVSPDKEAAGALLKKIQGEL